MRVLFLLCGVLAIAGVVSAGPQSNGNGNGNAPTPPPTPSSGSGPTGEDMTTSGGSFRLIGGSGWFEYCPAAASGNQSACFRIRPFAFEEQDASGSAVPLNGQNGRPRRINNLFSSMEVGRPQSSVMPHQALCSAFEERACGWTDATVAVGLSYQAIHISVGLSGIGAGASARLNITTYLFTANGTLRYDGQDVSVTEGTAKFDVTVSGYAFTANGAKLSFRIEVNAPGGSSPPSISVDPTTGASTVDGMMLNFPRFAYKTAANGTAWSWRNASVTPASGSLTYEFAGPFEEASYDPIVGTRGSIGGTGGSTTTSFPVAYIGIAVAAVVVIAAVGAFVFLRKPSGGGNARGGSKPMLSVPRE